MTRVDLPAPPPTGTAGGRRLDSNGGFEEADAGFLAQLATLAAEENGGSSLPAAKVAGEAVIARWWQAGGGPVPVLAPDHGGGAIEAVEMNDEALDVAAVVMQLSGEPAVDAPASLDPKPETEAGQQPILQVKDPLAPVGAPPISAAAPPVVMPAAVIVAMPPPGLPSPPVDQQPGTLPRAPWQPVAKDIPAQSPLPVVAVVRTETHFAPVVPVLPAAAVAPIPPAARPAIVERNGPADGRKPDQPTGVAKPAIPHPVLEGTHSAESAPQQAMAGHADKDASQQNAGGESAAPTAPLSARGLAHAGHPADPPGRQIAAEIVANLAPGEPGNSPAVLSSLPRPGAAHPVKVLTIQLHPVELGTVTVRMTLKGDAMDVEVEAGRRATAQAIDADREALTGLLRSAGYHVEALTVRAVDPSSTPSPPGSPPGSADGGPQLQSGGAQPDARASGNRAQPEPRGNTQLPDRNDNDGKQANGDRRGAGLYV
jgi:chemotaxis protein MotD